MTKPESALHVEVVGDEIVVSLPESQYSVTLLQGGNVSPAARKAHHRKIRSARFDDRVRVPRTGLEARHRQGPRAGVDSVAFRPRGAGMPLMRCGPLGRAPRK
jgi:hypothetical protein